MVTCRKLPIALEVVDTSPLAWVKVYPGSCTSGVKKARGVRLVAVVLVESNRMGCVRGWVDGG